MKKFIALLALVLVSASTMMYAQESNAAIRRADRKAERDAERAKLRAEEQVQDMAAYQQASLSIIFVTKKLSASLAFFQAVEQYNS